MVVDFSEPFNFAPGLFDIGKIVDPDSEGYEIDFKQWQEDQLIVAVEGEEKEIPIEEIIKEIKYTERRYNNTFRKSMTTQLQG